MISTIKECTSFFTRENYHVQIISTINLFFRKFPGKVENTVRLSKSGSFQEAREPTDCLAFPNDEQSNATARTI